MDFDLLLIVFSAVNQSGLSHPLQLERYLKYYIYSYRFLCSRPLSEAWHGLFLYESTHYFLGYFSIICLKVSVEIFGSGGLF